jgi:hypothetical protein
MRLYAALLLSFASFMVAVPSALAGKGGGASGTTSSSPSIVMATLNGTTMNASTRSLTPAYTNTVTWSTVSGSVAGWETPEVVLSCFQDVNGDGVVDTTLGGPDTVYSWINSPGAVFSFSGQGQTSTWSLRGGGAATCRADLDAYGWKSGQSTVRLLASTGNFPVSG